MKIQLITAVAALWSCRENRPDPDPTPLMNEWLSDVRHLVTLIEELPKGLVVEYSVSVDANC